MSLTLKRRLTRMGLVVTIIPIGTVAILYGANRFLVLILTFIVAEVVLVWNELRYPRGYPDRPEVD